MSSLISGSNNHEMVIASLEKRVSKTEKQLEDLTREFRRHLVQCKCKHSPGIGSSSGDIESVPLDSEVEEDDSGSNDKEVFGPVTVRPKTEQSAMMNDDRHAFNDSVIEIPFVKEYEVIRISDDESEVEDEEEPESFPCTKCDQVFANKKDLKQHRRSHRKRQLEQDEKENQEDEDNVMNPSSKKVARSSQNSKSIEISPTCDNEDNSVHQKLLSKKQFGSLIQKYGKKTSSNLFFKIQVNQGQKLYRLIIIVGSCSNNDVLYSLLQELGPSVGWLVIQCTDVEMNNIEWSMFKILQCLPRLYQLTLIGNTLRLDWSIPTGCPIFQLPSLIHVTVCMQWNPITERSFEYGHFLHVVAGNVARIRLYTNLFYGDSSPAAANDGYKEITNLMSNISKLNTLNLTELQFLNDASLINSRTHHALDYSPILHTVFPKIQKFAPPAFYPTADSVHVFRIQMSLCQVIGNMPNLTKLNLKNVFLGSSFSITLLRCPNLTDLTCNEFAFEENHIAEFEDCFPKLQQLIIWSVLTIQMSVQPYSPFADYLKLNHYQKFKTNVFLQLSHSKVKMLKLSFNFIDGRAELSFGQLFGRFPSLEHLGLHLMKQNYFKILKNFMNQVKSLDNLNTLTLSSKQNIEVVPIQNILSFLAGIRISGSAWAGTENACHVPNLIFESSDSNMQISLPLARACLLKLRSLKALTFRGITVTNFSELKLLEGDGVTVKSTKLPLRSGFCG